MYLRAFKTLVFSSLLLVCCVALSFDFSNTQFGLGFISQDVKKMNKSPGGISLSAGKIFEINEMFSTRTSLDFSYLRLKSVLELNGFRVAESTFNDYSYGVSQRLYFNVPVQLNFKVYGDLGFGISHTVVDFSSVLADRDEEESKNLFFYKYALGLQLLSQGGVGGELSLGYKKNKDYKGNYVDISFVYTI
jgi:hypothetical protein